MNVFGLIPGLTGQTNRETALHANALFDLGNGEPTNYRKKLQENRKSLVPVEHGKIVEAVNRSFENSTGLQQRKRLG